jgi:hypothetical protein
MQVTSLELPATSNEAGEEYHASAMHQAFPLLNNSFPK